MPARKPASKPKKAPAAKTPPLKIENRPVSGLKDYARNPRKNDHVVDKIVASITEFGFAIPVLIKGDGTVIDGHLRLKGARKLGMDEIPVIVCDHWSEPQIKAFRLLANKSVAWAAWDDELLVIELEELAEHFADLDSVTGFDVKEIEKLLGHAPVLEEGDAPTEERSSVLGVVIECDSEAEQMELLGEFNGRGLKCRALV